MDDKKNCKIIHDLLPNYIENLTNKETNLYIEEHISGCDECKKTLEKMKKEISTNNPKNDKRKVKYLKKYNRKLRILKLIILIIIFIFCFRVVRNLVITTSLSNKVEEYVKSNNYHKVSTSIQGDNMIICDVYYKDGNSKTVLKRIREEQLITLTSYYKNGLENLYIDTLDKKENLNKKSAVLNQPEYSFENGISNSLDFSELSIFQKILELGVFPNIKTVKCNGKICYFIDSRYSSLYLYQANTPSSNSGFFVDKETGLVVRYNDGSVSTENGYSSDIITNIRYEFDTVTDKDLEEPDISEYEVQEIK